MDEDFGFDGIFHDMDADEVVEFDDPMGFEDDLYASMYDDDPNPYHGTFSEE